MRKPAVEQAMTRYALNETMRRLGAGVPARVRHLPVSPQGYYVPWFVAWLRDGAECRACEVGAAPDFRVIGAGKIAQAVRWRRCWVCGGTLGRHMAFVAGPMCAVNRTSSEPPSHRECAVFSAHACPFLSDPRMRRNAVDMPPQHQGGAGIMIKRNPGVALVWVTCGYHRMRVANGILFRVGDPEEVLWFCEGRPATRAEVMASIESGLPLLRAVADKDFDAAGAQAELERLIDLAMPLVPAG